MKDYNDITTLSYQPHELRDLKSEVKVIYDRRMSLTLVTEQQMEDYVDIMDQNFQPYELKDLKPEVKEVYKRRAEYHNMISNLLMNSMIEVTDDFKKIAVPEEDESAKSEC